MYPHEFNKLTKKFIVESGHGLCHPETCTCWEFRLYTVNRHSVKGINVLNTDSASDVSEYLINNDPDYHNA